MYLSDKQVKYLRYYPRRDQPQGGVDSVIERGACENLRGPFPAASWVAVEFQGGEA